MDEKIIARDIEESNKWWKGDFHIPEYKYRKIYREIKKFIRTKQIIAITGLRRVGKTTMILKLINERLNEGFPKMNIFYFSFDEYANVRIYDIIDIYEKINGKSIKTENYFFAFDEIQKVKNWEEQLKKIYDVHPNIKFVISGSESLFIRRKSRESLAGRIYEFLVNPLSFKEYLEFKDLKFDNLLLYRKNVLDEFGKFLLSNGFPEIINADIDIAKKYVVEGVINKILYHDMGEIFGIKDTSIVRAIFNVIYNNPGQIIEIQELAGEIGITRQLLSEYLEYLEESYLIKKLYNYSKNARKTQRRLKRYYSTIVNPLLIKDSFSKVFEQALVLGCNSEYFWRDSYKNEVDIILLDPLTAIEIKSGGIKERDLKSLQSFIKKFKPKEAKVISYDIENEINGIKIIPFYKYLLAELK